MKSFRMYVCLAMLLSSVACSCGTVTPGNVGIVVNNMGGGKGVGEEVGVGFYVRPPWTDIYEFPMFEQNYTWSNSPHEGAPHDESFTFQSKEGMLFGANIGVSYHIAPGKAGDVLQRYRKPLHEIQNIYLHNMVRDSLMEEAGKMEAKVLAGPGKTDFVNAVQAAVQGQLKDTGIVVTKISLAGAFTMPQAVSESITAGVQAQNIAIRVQNELATTQAEAAKQAAQAKGAADAQIEAARGEATRTKLQAEAEATATLSKAQAQAKANDLLNKSLTTTLVDYERVRSWDGKLPVTMLGGNTGTLLNLK